MDQLEGAVERLTTYAHVLDLDRSIEFYSHLGFSVLHDWVSDGKVVWAQLESGDARLMIAQGSPFDPSEQAVLFYCHTPDVGALRERLVAAGLKPGLITYPDYMPAGEIRIHDPDGYVLLIGQLET